MTAIKNTGTSSEIKEQYEKYEKFGGGFFNFPLQREKSEGGPRWCEKMRERIGGEIVEVESVKKNRR